MEGNPHDIVSALPDDWETGVFVGRMLTEAGPSPLLVVCGELYDMSAVSPTVRR